ncbi:MAG: sigma-70 family RNA polymerase sigma factor [Tenericutes bacterium]|nr:sigma-70 family RNA polymerase sigma factor [Mycoplasmatota bacterium]
MEYNDQELSLLFTENDENAKDVLFKKYNYIIEIIINKYKKTIYALNMDINEIRQDANLAFTDAIIKYSREKETSLPTFISLVVERKIQNAVRKAETIKNKVYLNAYSLDYEYDVFQKPLSEIIGDNSGEPLANMTKKEEYEELVNNINSILSPGENDVYKLLIRGFNYQEIAKILNKEPKQIDNSIQRIRIKIRDLIK